MQEGNSKRYGRRASRARSIARSTVWAGLLLTVSQGALGAQPASESDPVEAQEQPQAPAEEKEVQRAEAAPESKSAPAQGQPGASAKTEAQGEPGDFTPSEEISEDFAVSFPVDI
jgi:hypothetical protein